MQSQQQQHVENLQALLFPSDDQVSSDDQVYLYELPGYEDGVNSCIHCGLFLHYAEQECVYQEYCHVSKKFYTSLTCSQQCLDMYKQKKNMSSNSSLDSDMAYHD